MITFSTALPLFAITLTLVYTVLLLMSKVEEAKRGVGRGPKIYMLASLFTLVLSVAGASLVLLTGFKETIPYYILLAALTTLIVLTASKADSPTLRAMLIFNIVMWHITMVFSQLPSTGISVGEGGDMVMSLLREGHWEFSAAHNPSYNPLPTVALNLALLNYLTSLPWYNVYLVFIYYFLLIAAYDIIVYALAKEVTSSRVAGLIAMLFVGLTPATNIVMHPYQWSGNLLILISVLMLIRVLRGFVKPHSYIIVMNLCFGSAVLIHATAAVGNLFPLAAMAVAYLTWRLLKLQDRDTLNIMTMRNFLILVFTTLMSITIARVIYTYGYLGYIWPMMSNFLIEMFFPYEKAGVEGFTPLYDRAGVNFVQAYSWALAIAMATAFIISSLVRRRVKVWHLALYATATLLILAGYVVGAHFKVVASSAMYRGTYVAIPLIFPLAAMALTKTLRAGKTIALVSLLLVVVSVPIASHDPNVSPIEYARIRGAGEVELSPTDILEAQEVNFLLSDDPLELKGVLQNLVFKSEVMEVGQYTPIGGPTWAPTLSNRLKEALSLLWFISGQQGYDIKITLSDDGMPPNNRVYDSGRSQIFFNT